MPRKYKYIDGGNFPYLDNLDIPDNAFDYSTWPVGTVIRVLHVPWDRDYSNVVKFDNDEARDKWIIEHTSTEYKLETAINIQPNGTIKLPIPFDVLGRSNFIAVSYAWAPVDYEQNPRVQTIGYFIDNIQQLAPSTTAAHITVDYWFTYINDLDISFMMLERGHAPVAATNANWFLEDPINRNELLTTPDVNFGPERARVKQAAEWVANDGNAYAVIACTGNVLSQYWGTKGTRTMETPGIASANWYGLAGGLDYFALRLADLNDFIVQCNAHRPHFLPTIQGLFLIPGKLLTFVQKFTWENFSMDMWTIDTNQKRYNLITLNKTAFDYPKPYRDLAKLYTAPYAHLEITDETGRVSRVDVENTSGHIDIDAALNLVHPFVGLDVMIIGNGDAGTITSTFGYGSDRTFQHGGDWYTTMHRYGIPSFIVSQSQNDRAQFNRFFPNAQAATARDNALASALASNDTGKTNADASTNTANTNALASNDTGYTNTNDNLNAAYNNIEDGVANALSLAIKGNQYQFTDSYNAVAVSDTAFQNNLQANLITTMNGGVNTVGGMVGSGLNGNAAGMLAGATELVVGMSSYPLLLTMQEETYKASRKAAIAHYEGYYQTTEREGHAGYGEQTASGNATVQRGNNTRTRQEKGHNRNILIVWNRKNFLKPCLIWQRQTNRKKG